jgi:VanZ family protein
LKILACVFWWRCLFAILFLAVVYFSWKPSPAIAQVPWFPQLLAAWLDQHDFSKNVLGYGVFAMSGFMAWSTPASAVVNHLMLLLSFCLLIAILEVGQLALPHRVCDWADVLAGWLGVLLAWSIFQLVRVFLTGRPARHQL